MSTAIVAVVNEMLVNYDRMICAISECCRLDEVKAIRDKTVALQAYARQAGNSEAEIQVLQIRLWAERRAGELLIEMKETGARDPGGRGRIEFRQGTQLSSWGINKKQSWLWQKIAQIPEESFRAFIKHGGLDAYSLIRQGWDEAFDSLDRLSVQGAAGPPDALTSELESLARASPGLKPIKTIRVKFRKSEDLEAFGAAIGQKINMGTKRPIWYPELDHGEVMDMLGFRQKPSETEAAAD